MRNELKGTFMLRLIRKVSLDEILLFFLLLFGPLAHGLVETWSITIAYIVIIFLVSFVVLTRIYKGNIVYYRTPADILIALFLICIFVSYCLSVYPYASRIVIYKLLAALALFFYIINTQRSREKINLLLWVIVIFGSIYAIMGLTLIDGDFLGFKIYSQSRYNISLFYVNRNHFAGYLEMVFCLAIGLAGALTGGKRILLFGMTVLIATALLFSLSRGGIIGVACGLSFYIITLPFIHRHKRGRLLFFAAIALGLIIIAWFGLHPVLERLSTLNDPSLAGEGRMQVWRDTLRMIYERPFFGWGPGTFSVAFPAYQTQGFDQKIVNYAHNDYLELAANTGVLGLTAFISGFLALYISCLRKLARSPVRGGTYWQNVGVGALAACFSLFIHSVTDCNLQIPANLFLFAITGGVAVIAADSSGKGDISRGCVQLEKKNQRRLLLVVSCLAACASIVVVLLPLFGEWCFQAARADLYQKKYDQAVLEIGRALFFNPDNADFLSYKGDILLTKKNAKDTVVDVKNCTGCGEITFWYEKASCAARTNSLYFVKKATILEQYADKTAAEEAYKEAIRLSPMYAPSYYNIAILYIRQRKIDEAINFFLRYLKLEGVREVPKVLDDIWSAGGDYQVQQRAIPEIASFRQAFARYLALDGENKLAEQEAAFAFSLEPSVSNAFIHLNILQGNKKFSGLLAAFERYLLLFPKDIELKERYAAALEQAQQYQDAVLVYRQIMEGFPEGKARFEKYFIKISRLYARQKLYEDAVLVLQEGGAQYPRAAGLYQVLGSYFRAMGKNEDALHALKKAVSLNPDNASFRYQLGQEYLRHKLELEALREWKACLTINSQYTHCQKGIEKIRNKFGLLNPAK
ncbi:MAG: O-antigen ligase family protein [Candidatus Electrothrix aestuarii]|uniref:O-antigen ligase family protein n=1 Tax=Candidatus Electrothrix aestuarii TaxID=3062594 RepID=A0AAU8M0Y0_9BACT|nr:O-antigen ligase family protein [Candidatus Electrothrix aestuarii]